MKHKVHIDRKAYLYKKPDENGVRRIRHDFLDLRSIPELEEEEIIHGLETGHAMQLANCPYPDQEHLPPNTGTRKDYFVSQSVFGLDIDNDEKDLPSDKKETPPPKETVKSILRKADEAGLIVGAIIPSLSSEEWIDESQGLKKPFKAHVLFFLDEPILLPDLRDKIQDAIASVFDYVDPKPNSAAGILYGSNKKAVYINTKTRNNAIELGRWALKLDSLKPKYSARWDGTTGGRTISWNNEPIKDHERNTVMHGIARNKLIYFGPDGIEEARAIYEAAFSACEQPPQASHPYTQSQADATWNSALRWVSEHVWNQEGYKSKKDFDEELAQKSIRADFDVIPDSQLAEYDRELEQQKPPGGISGFNEYSTFSKQQNGQNEKKKETEPGPMMRGLLDQALKPAKEIIRDFKEDIESERYKSIPTGIDVLDRILDGGIYPGLCLLGAETGQGKTTLALQIADYIASTGRDVIYFSLEMPATALQARSISRMSYERYGQDSAEQGKPTLAMQAQEVRSKEKRKSWKKGQEILLDNLIAEYEETIAPHMKCVYTMRGLSSDQIQELVYRYVSNYIENPEEPLTEEQESHLPLVVVDYLQILQGHPKQTEKEKTDTAVFDLKGLSEDYLIPVLVISSFNRQSYKEPVDLGAFKESGGIEYTADIVLALQFYGMDWKENESQGQRSYRIMQTKKTVNERKSRGEPIWLELKVLKNRYGNTGMVALDYYAKYNLFKEGSSAARAAFTRKAEENRKAKKQQEKASMPY